MPLLYIKFSWKMNHAIVYHLICDKRLSLSFSYCQILICSNILSMFTRICQSWTEILHKFSISAHMLLNLACNLKIASLLNLGNVKLMTPHCWIWFLFLSVSAPTQSSLLPCGSRYLHCWHVSLWPQSALNLDEANLLCRSCHGKTGWCSASACFLSRPWCCCRVCQAFKGSREVSPWLTRPQDACHLEY